MKTSTIRMWGCFVFTILVVRTIAEVPSYITVCGRRNPHINKCIVDSINSLQDKLRVGIPELDVPPLEPMKLMKDLKLTMSDDLLAIINNVKLYNIYKYNVKDINLQLEKKRIDIRMVFDRIKLTGNYNVSTKIILPISGSGPIEMSIGEVEARAVLLFKIVKSQKSNRLFFSEMKCKLTVPSYTILPNDKDDSFSEILNAIVSSDQKEILDILTPQFEEVVAENVLDISNKIANHFTFEEIYPDRE